MGKINVQNDIKEKQFFSSRNIIDICTEILGQYSINFYEINIIISYDEYVRKLKKDFFEIDVYTDVISFNLEDEGDPIDGEIYISWERVKENANTFEVSLNSELKRVIIHGILHLIGYDDGTKEEKQAMTDLENKFLDANSKLTLI
tara:strand:- start:875 stop:1312 length:438 start_codon:yes stop_codon:yes gene_type:complete